MKYKIADFTNRNKVEVNTLELTNQHLVIVSQAAGSCHFQHAMSIDQARFMATALALAADEAEHAANAAKVTGEAV